MSALDNAQQRSYRSNSTTNEWLQAMTSPPFTSDKADDLYNLIADQFEAINDDISPLVLKLNELKSPDRLTVNSQFE